MGKLLVLALVAAVLAGCSSPASPPPTAEAAVAKLKEAGAPIGETVMYTAESDPNKLLGRPGGYTGKVDFKDTRIMTPVGTGEGVDAGGSIEVFGSQLDADKRRAYVTGIATSSPMFAEYTERQGRVVLRLSRALTPDQVQQYVTTLRGLD